nr:unnamed protein product [Digitaria exilis]
MLAVTQSEQRGSVRLACGSGARAPHPFPPSHPHAHHMEVAHERRRILVATPALVIPPSRVATPLPRNRTDPPRPPRDHLPPPPPMPNPSLPPPWEDRAAGAEMDELAAAADTTQAESSPASRPPWQERWSRALYTIDEDYEQQEDETEEDPETPFYTSAAWPARPGNE